MNTYLNALYAGDNNQHHFHPHSPLSAPPPTALFGPSPLPTPSPPPSSPPLPRSSPISSLSSSHLLHSLLRFNSKHSPSYLTFIHLLSHPHHLQCSCSALSDHLLFSPSFTFAILVTSISQDRSYVLTCSFHLHRHRHDL